MKLALVTDAWLPQVNGVVTTLLELQDGLISRGHEVRIAVEPPQGTASGTYTGSLHDPAGVCLFEEVAVYVVGDKSP